MVNEKVVVLMGSKRDYEFATRISNFLEEQDFPIECEYNVASAHKTPKKLLDDLDKYERSGNNIVLITVAGLSDALSGVVAGYSRYPVIACPPDSERYGWAKIFSSVSLPEGISVVYVLKPENAALAAVKIFALSNRMLYKKLVQYRQKLEKRVYEDAEKIGKTPNSKKK